jgi:hypothetical protein
MSEPVFFDHIEVHVGDIVGYGKFLERLFRGGRFKQISDSGTSMFITPDGVNLEIKLRERDAPSTEGGFRLPCIRVAGAKEHLESLRLEISREVANPEGAVFFFRDAEGIEWHAKNYVHRDRYVNW